SSPSAASACASTDDPGAMRLTWRGAELSLLLPIVLLVPLGFAITHIAVSCVALFAAAHFVLVLFGHRGDQLLLPAVGALGGIGMIMLNRLPQDLAGTSGFGLELGMAATQLLW